MTAVIGLTGGIGSGKSTVAQCLAELGAEHIDADKVGHEAFGPNTPAYGDIVATFGADVLTPSGQIDRKKLGQIVFSDPKARHVLNAIMWSRIWEVIAGRIDDMRRRQVAVVVVEAFGLIEAGWTRHVDSLWVTVASESVVIERLKEGRHLSESDILARMRSQMTNDERIRHADVVIRNDLGPEELKASVKREWDNLRRRLSAT